MQDGGVIPDYRVPTGRRHGKRGGTCNDNSDTVQHEHLIQHMHLITIGHLGGYTFEACIFGADRVRYDVEEVVVLVTIVEVVVHGHRGSSRSRQR